MRNRMFFLLILTANLLTAPLLAAQQLTGAMSGTVRDSSGAVVAGAKVVVVNADTNLRISGESSRNGAYQFADIPAGTYSITFSLSGFKSELHSTIIVEGNRTTTVRQVGSGNPRSHSRSNRHSVVEPG